MSASPRDPIPQHDPAATPELNEALVLLYRLSNEAIERINELMGSLHIKFSEAALHTGVISQQELDEAMEWVRQRAMLQGRGIVEEVLRRNALARQAPVRTGVELIPGPRLILAHDPNHPRSETLRTLRTELLLRLKGGRGTSAIAVISPSAGEGRSQLVSELAVAFAQLGRRTLLVDADLRRPTLHTLFSADNESGLSQALVDFNKLELNRVRGLPEMAVLTSGPVPPNPAELLSSRQFERVLGIWRRNFEFILLDTPPAAEFSDGLAVASAVGNVLMLSRVATTSFSALGEMRRKLEATQARTLGAVLNRF
jgi:protein-tyrosine kinase